jgi:hypothetical protein
MEFDVSLWYKQNVSQNSVLAYKGDITEDIISEILSDIEQNLEVSEENTKLIKKCYNVTVEALQNLFHHTENTPKELKNELGERFSVFVLKKQSDAVYKIQTGNFVKEKKVKLIKDRTEQINFLSNDELKILYKIILNNEEFSKKGGGGLGLIDIARKTGNKLTADFYKCNADYFFFSLEIVIS